MLRNRGDTLWVVPQALYEFWVVATRPTTVNGLGFTVARAVAELRVLAEYCLPLCQIGGRFLAPKGARIEDELQAALPAIAQLGGRLVAIEPVVLPELEPRTLVIIEKINPTPPQYPRAPGVPAKRPL